MRRKILVPQKKKGKMTAATNHAKMREPAEEEKQGEHNEEEEKVMSVKVAVMVRPMLEDELVDGNDIAIFADEEKPKAYPAQHPTTRSRTTTCIAEKIRSLKRNYTITALNRLFLVYLTVWNGTVLAYGQTGKAEDVYDGNERGGYVWGRAQSR